MFKKIHKKLTLLFTGITGFILIVMSINYIYIAEQNLKENSYYSFQSDCKTLLTNLEGQSVITYEWLHKTESNGKYQIGLYDNGISLSFSLVTKNENQKKLLQEAKEYGEIQYGSDLAGSKVTAYREFIFTDTEKAGYYACVAHIAEKKGNLEAVILYSLEGLHGQIVTQRLIFLIIDLFFLCLLAVFSWFFTKKLLKPIEDNQKKQTRFVAAASHELRTPLTVILSSLSALQKAENAEKEAFLSTIQNEGFQMARLLNDMLTLANADHQTWDIHKDKVELDTLVLNSYEAFGPMAKEKKITIALSLPKAGIPCCYCDKHRIEQVLSILLHNAVSYGKEMGIILISLEAAPVHFILSVADNGAGIPDKDKPYIFDRFYRADTSRNKKEHFGLGLSIAKEIIDAHKGSIHVKDTKGGGSTFTVVLPR